MKRLLIGLAVLVVAMDSVRQVDGATYINDFDDGIGSDFFVFDGSNGLYTVDTDAHTLRIYKSADDGSYKMYSQIICGIASNLRIHGDFIVTVDFALHNFPDAEGIHKLNESLLAVVPESAFGGPFDVQSLFEVLRFRLGDGNLIEVFTYSPVVALGVTNSDLSSGRYRISRSGTTVTGAYAQSNSSEFITIASVDYSLEPMLIELYAAQGKNEGERSHTSLDISFDNLFIEADMITIIPEPSTLVLFTMGIAVLLMFSCRR